MNFVIQISFYYKIVGREEIGDVLREPAAELMGAEFLIMFLVIA